MKTIYDFNKGDVITRICPAKEYSPVKMGLFGPEGGVRDRSYIGDRLIFIGIANGTIYCKRDDDFSKMMFGDKLLELQLDVFYDGWDFYVDPNSLLDAEDTILLDESSLNEQLEKAVNEENYELAANIKVKLDKLTKKI